VEQRYAEIAKLDESIATNKFKNPILPIHCEFFFHIVKREQVVDEDP
jgi:hypothetical protein